MEEIIIKVVVDGKEQTPIKMEAGKEDIIYNNDMVFFNIGHVYDKEGTVSLYDYTIRLRRRKTKEEEGK